MGVDRLQQQLGNFIGPDGNLTTGTAPFNVFARFASGVMALPPNAQEAQAKISEEQRSKFLICFNRKEDEEQWESSDPAWVGKASMSKRHVFITTKDISWPKFNVLTYGMFGDEDLRSSLQLLKELRQCAMDYVKSREDWGANVGMYMHIFGACSVNSMHLHVLDRDFVGPSFEAIQHRNMSIDDAIAALQQEL